MARHLDTLIPRQCAAGNGWEIGDRRCQCGGEFLSATLLGQVDQTHISGCAVYQRADRRQAVTADDQVAFEVADPLAGQRRCGALIDRPRVCTESWPAAARIAAPHPQPSSCAEVSDQIPCQTVTSTEI
jgi:hypothetical protein